MNMTFSEMKETARQIENLALLLRTAAETGQLANLGDEVVEDAAAVIQEKAQHLEKMIQVCGNQGE